MECFLMFYSKDQRFYQRILKISKSSFIKRQTCEIFFFSKFHGLLFVFLFFLFFLKFSFQFHLFVHVKKIQKFLYFFILLIRDVIKDFWKIMEHFSKKYRHLKSKILHKFHRLLFVFLFFFIFDIFFSISSICTCQKNLEIFMFFYFMDQRFNDFWKIMEHFSKKYRHLKSKILDKSILYYLFFSFFLFLTFSFQFRLFVHVKKFQKFFVVFYSRDQRFYQRILEISKSSFTKRQICETIFFFKIPRFTICFFIFYFIYLYL